MGSLLHGSLESNVPWGWLLPAPRTLAGHPPPWSPPETTSEALASKLSRDLWPPIFHLLSVETEPKVSCTQAAPIERYVLHLEGAGGRPCSFGDGLYYLHQPFLVMLDPSSGGCEHFRSSRFWEARRAGSTGGTGSLPRAPNASSSRRGQRQFCYDWHFLCGPWCDPERLFCQLLAQKTLWDGHCVPALTHHQEWKGSLSMNSQPHFQKKAEAGWGFGPHQLLLEDLLTLPGPRPSLLALPVSCMYGEAIACLVVSAGWREDQVMSSGFKAVKWATCVCDGE